MDKILKLKYKIDFLLLKFSNSYIILSKVMIINNINKLISNCKNNLRLIEANIIRENDNYNLHNLHNLDKLNKRYEKFENTLFDLFDIKLKLYLYSKKIN